MPITRKFRETILSRAERDAVFRRQMLTEAVNEMLTGDLEAGKTNIGSAPLPLPHIGRYPDL